MRHVWNAAGRLRRWRAGAWRPSSSLWLSSGQNVCRAHDPFLILSYIKYSVTLSRLLLNVKETTKGLYFKLIIPNIGDPDVINEKIY